MGGLVLPGSGGGYVNPIATPVVDYDFKQGLLYGPALSITRASSAYIDDLAGNWTLVPANTLRRSDKGVLIEGQATNSIRNNSMQGAVAGSPGTLPPFWTAPTTVDGLSRQVVGTGAQNGFEYIDIRYSGTATGASGIAISPEAVGAIAAAAGQLWTSSALLSLAPGSTMTGVTSWRFRVTERPGGGATDTIFTPTYVTQRIVTSRTLNDTTTPTTSITSQVQIGYNNGAAVDFTIRIGWPQLEQWNPAVTTVGGASSPIRTTGAAATRAADVVTGTLAQALSSLTVAGVVQPLLSVTNGAIIHLGITNDRIILRQTSSNALNVIVQVGGTTVGQATTAANSLPVGTRAAFALAVSGTDVALSINGAPPVVTTLSAPIAPVTVFQLGAGIAQNAFYGAEERLAILPARMVNAELQRLSTLSTWGG